MLNFFKRVFSNGIFLICIVLLLISIGSIGVKDQLAYWASRLGLSLIAGLIGYLLGGLKDMINRTEKNCKEMIDRVVKYSDKIIADIDEHKEMTDKFCKEQREIIPKVVHESILYIMAEYNKQSDKIPETKEPDKEER